MTMTLQQVRPPQQRVRMTRYRPTYRHSRASRIIRWLSLANLAIVAVLTAGILMVSENWWLTHILTYLPRAVYVLPAMVLLVLAAQWHPRSVLTNLVATGLVLGPLMGFQLPWRKALQGTADGTSLTIASCNVQGFEPNFGSVLSELAKHDPDVIALQEASGQHTLLDQWFADWHVVHEEDFVVASRFPIQLAGKLHSSVYDRPLGIRVAVDGPDGPFQVVNLHLMTARHALTDVTPGGIVRGTAMEIVENESKLREIDAMEARSAVADAPADQPLIVAGDFNVPSSSSLYSSVWRGQKNAFDTAGWGYGYSAPCSNHRTWFDNTPWLRIDHVLVDSDVIVEGCEVGTGNGSDHRPVIATIRIRGDGESAD